MPTRSTPASPSMPESWQSHDAGFCRLQGETNNKPHSVAFSKTFDCSQTVGAFEVHDNRLRRKVRDKPVDQLLFGFLENGRISRQRTGHDEARSGSRRVAVESVSTVCSQRLPQTCLLEFRACDESRFPHSHFQKFDRYVRDPVALLSVLHAPNKVFGE